MKRKLLMTFVALLLLTVAATGPARADWTGGTYTATSNEYLDDGTIYVESDATLTINQGVTVTVESGIIMRNNATLTITGGGKLIVTVDSRGFSAIEGNVIVMGGTTVEATGGEGEVGSSGQEGDNCSDGENGGPGSDGLSAFSGNVTIYSGSITANGGQGGHGGGGGNGGDCDQPGQKGGKGGNGGDAGDGGPAFSGTLTIYGGTVIATGGAGGDQMIYGDGGMGDPDLVDPQGDHGNMGAEGDPTNAFTSNIITFQVDPSTINGGLDEDDYSAIGQNDITTPEKYYIQIVSSPNDPVVDPVTYVTRQILVEDVDGWDGDHNPLTADVLSNLYDGHFNSITFQEACSWEAPQGDSWLIYSVSNGVFSYVTFYNGAPTSGSTTFTGELRDLYNEMGNNNVKIYYPYELSTYSLTIGVNDGQRGSVEMLIGTVWDSTIWNNNDWARVRNFSRSSNNITISVSDTASSLSNYSSTGKNNRGYFDLNLYERYSESLTFASGSDKNFEHIQLLSTKPYFEEYEAEVNGHNMTIYSNFYVTPSTGWSYTEGEKNIDWHGDLRELVLTKCTAYVDQIVFTRVGDSLRVVATAPNEYSIYENDQVNVRATANTGYHLTGWSNDFPVNASNTVRATITRDSTIIANFDTNEYNLTVNVANGQDAMGEVSGSNPAVKHFLNYQISATPNQGYIFKEWNDGNTDAVRTVTLTENTTYTASFAPDTFTVVVNTNNEQYGTVTVGGSIEPVIGENSYSGSGAPYESGSEYSYVQQIYTGSEVQYSGTINAISFYLTYSINSSATNDFTLFMKNVERETFANNSDFEPVTASDIVFEGDWTIPADYTGWVTINLDTPFEYDNTKNLLIAMDENTDGYQNLLFANHPKSASVVSAYSSTNPDPSTIGEFSGSKQVRSNRAQLKLDMDVDGIALGGILVNDSTFRFAYNSEVTVTATAVPGNNLVAWSNGVAVSSPESQTQNITILRDTVIRATFAPNPYVNLSVNNSNMGSIDIVPNESINLVDQLTVASSVGSTFKVNLNGITPEDDQWINNTDNPGFVQVQAIDASSAPFIHHVVIFNDGGDSLVLTTQQTDNSSSAKYLTIRLTSGYIYTNMFTKAPLMNGGFSSIKVYASSSSMPEGIVATATPGVYQVPTGTQITVRASRTSAAYYLSSWSNGVAVSDRTSDVQILTVTADTSIAATFVSCPYLTLAANPEQAGTVTLNSNPNTIALGNNTYGVLPDTKVVLRATPAAGYHLSDWSQGSANLLAGTDTIVMGFENLTVSANFESNPVVRFAASPEALGTLQVSFGGNFDRQQTIFDGSNTNATVPVFSNGLDGANTRSQHIIPADQLTQLANSSITGVTYYTSLNSSWTSTSNVRVYLKEVDSTNLGGAFIDITDATKVYDGVLNFAYNSGSYRLAITFSTPFQYHGGNLLVGFYNTAEGNCREIYFYGVGATSGSAAYGNANGLVAINFLPKTTFNFTSPVPDGVVILSDSTFSAASGTQFSITATPAEYCSFSNWQDQSTESTINVTLGTSDTTFTATFSRTLQAINDIPMGWSVTADGEAVIVDDNNTALVPIASHVKLIPPVPVKPTVKDVTVSKALELNKTPLTLVALTAGTIVVNSPKNGMQYTLNGGEKQPVTSTAITVAIGDKVAFYGNGTNITVYNGTTISGGTAQVRAYGNIMSLLNETGYESATTLPNQTWVFNRLFANNTTLTNASKLLLPATTLATACYYDMFNGCTSLTAAPALLPATTLAECCYTSMFYGCTSLTAAPELPATTLGEFCYQTMFYGCTSLTAAPELPATTLARSCYYNMFNGCTSLTAAPELPATTLIKECYYQMFQNCSNLSSVTCLATNISATDCTARWLDGAGSNVTGTKTFTTPSTTGWSSNYNGIPSGWTRVDAPAAAPAVPSLNIDIYGRTIYYSEGETWAQAIENYPTYNAGWNLDEGKVYFDDGNYSYFLLTDDSDYTQGSEQIDPGSHIYTFE